MVQSPPYGRIHSWFCHPLSDLTNPILSHDGLQTLCLPSFGQNLPIQSGKMTHWSLLHLRWHPDHPHGSPTKNEGKDHVQVHPLEGEWQGMAGNDQPPYGRIQETPNEEDQFIWNQRNIVPNGIPSLHPLPLEDPPGLPCITSNLLQGNSGTWSQLPLTTTGPYRQRRGIQSQSYPWTQRKDRSPYLPNQVEGVFYSQGHLGTGAELRIHQATHHWLQNQSTKLVPWVQAPPQNTQMMNSLVCTTVFFIFPLWFSLAGSATYSGIPSTQTLVSA